MGKQPVEKIIKQLKNVQLRPGMYFRGDLPSATSFIDGFNVACALWGLYDDMAVVEAGDKAMKEHGWKVSSLGPFPEMQERGLNEEQMIAEFLSIEIAKWEYLIIHQTGTDSE